MPQARLERAGWADDPGGEANPSLVAAFAGWVLLAGFLLALRLALVSGSALVTVEVDGHRRQVQTRAGTVAELLAEPDIGAQRGDLVQPAPRERLATGALVTIHRARPVRILVDGARIEVRSHSRSLLGVLQEAGVTVGSADRIELNGHFWPADRPAISWAPAAPTPRGTGTSCAACVPTQTTAASRLVASLQSGPLDIPPAIADVQAERSAGRPGDSATWEVEVHRAVPVTIVEANLRQDTQLAGDSIGEALRAAGISVRRGDVLRPPADAPLVAGMRIDIARGTPFRVTEAGTFRAERAWASTVGEALAAVGLTLQGADYSIPPADAALEPGMQIEVVRVVEDILVQEVPIAYGTVTEPDDTLELDSRVVLRPGEPGLKEQRVRIRYENGREVARHVEEERVIREPVAERVAYGTKVVWQTVDTPEGPKRYWRKLRAYATSYSASRAGTPRSAPWYGRTRMGLPARRGIIAVDRRIIPLGTWVYVPGYGVALAGDTGGGIRRYHIDLCFDDDAYESWHQYVDVYLLEPLPPADDMPWLLP